MQNSTQPLISIITINYNQSHLTEQLISSIYEQRYPGYEIIVVDNGSKEDATWLKVKFPKILFLQSKENLGFAGGNNLGISRASGEYIFFVNNDTEFSHDLIEKLLDTFNIDERIAVVSPKIKYFSNPDIIQYAGASSVNKLTGRNRMIGKNEIDQNKYFSGYTSFAHGAAMMVSSKALNDVGMMPEDYFLYYEELDWCEMFKRKGYQVYFQSNAEILHKESMSIGKESLLKLYYMTKNRILFMKRNYSSHYYLFLTYVFLVIAPIKTFMYILKFELSRLRVFYKGTIHGVTK